MFHPSEVTPPQENNHKEKISETEKNSAPSPAGYSLEYDDTTVEFYYDDGFVSLKITGDTIINTSEGLVATIYIKCRDNSSHEVTFGRMQFTMEIGDDANEQYEPELSTTVMPNTTKTLIARFLLPKRPVDMNLKIWYSDWNNSSRQVVQGAFKLKLISSGS